MTAKQRVLASYPNAYCTRDTESPDQLYRVILWPKRRVQPIYFGIGGSAQAAWKDAAANTA